MLSFRMFGMFQSIIVGVFVHILMLYSVFDIYFVSPIHHGMTPHKSEAEAPAKRLVLFVADGLRASSLYGRGMKVHTPFLSNIVENEGSWGISHTQVPTESRPGHVALLAGFNEDPSALTKGWKVNPVDFDSVINQSTNAWCWGSPDIVNMFNKDNLPHIRIQSYDSYLLDFSGRNDSTTQLDHWVFNKVRRFFVEHQTNKTKCKEACDEGNIFFLHLLGLDTAGHSIKPTSNEYLKNIEVVDTGVTQIVSFVENFYNDKKTAYFFTADHGMTDWGSHGDSSKDETEVPFIAWGSGILRNVDKQDMEQINIAPLLSSLIGVNIPVNSVGLVPIYILNVTHFQKAHILYANTRQLGEQYTITHSTLEKNTLSWAFQPFPQLSLESLANKLTAIRNHIVLTEFEEAVDISYKIVQLCKEGLKYYHNYYQKVLLFFVTIGFIGWIFYLFILIIKFSSFRYNMFRLPNLSRRAVAITEIAAIIIYFLLAVVVLFVFVQSLPIKFYMYCILWFTWIAVARSLKVLAIFCSFFQRTLSRDYLITGLVYIIGIEILKHRQS